MQDTQPPQQNEKIHKHNGTYHVTFEYRDYNAKLRRCRYDLKTDKLPIARRRIEKVVKAHQEAGHPVNVQFAGRPLGTKGKYTSKELKKLNEEKERKNFQRRLRYRYAKERKNVDVRITFCITQSEHEKLYKMAGQRGLTISEFVREQTVNPKPSIFRWITTKITNLFKD